MNAADPPVGVYAPVSLNWPMPTLRLSNGLPAKCRTPVFDPCGKLYAVMLTCVAAEAACGAANETTAAAASAIRFIE